MFDEKLLGRNLAAIDADTGTARLLQESAPFDEDTLILVRLAVYFNVVDLAFSHKPLAGDPGRPGIHSGRKLCSNMTQKKIRID